MGKPLTVDICSDSDVENLDRGIPGRVSSRKTSRGAKVELYFLEGAIIGQIKLQTGISTVDVTYLL